MFHRSSSFSDAVFAEEHKGCRGVVVGGARAESIGALERRVACREKSVCGRKPGVITVLAVSLLKRHFDLTFLADFYTHLHRWNPLCAGRWKCIQVAESHELFMYQKATGIHLAAYAAHAREVHLQEVEIGPMQKLALAVVLNWAA
jgi:hypothetical protein